MAVDHDALSENRLDSWKEIAAFLGRAERTVKRWEAERGLPVHRLPGGGRSAVFAYKNELAEWLKQPAGALDSGEVPAASQQSTESGAVLQAADPFPLKPVDAAPVARGRFHLTATAAWLVLAALAVGLIVLSAGGSKFWPIPRTSQRAANAEAQELYLKGRYFWNRRTPEDLNKAIEYFTQAIVKDPAEAQAYVGLADCYNLLPEFGAMAPGEAYPRAIAAAQRAVALDEKSAEAHNSLAFPTFWWSWQAATAEREFKRALQLNPNFVRGHHWYATYLMEMRRYPEALDHMEQAQRLDPASPAILADKGLLLWTSGRREEGLALLKQLEASEPALSSPHYFLARIFEQQGDYSAAIQEWKTLAELRHDEAGAKIAQAAAQGYAAGGVRGLLEGRLPLQKEIVDRGDGSAYELAATYAALNRKQEALAYLQVAYDRRDQDLLGSDPPIPTLIDDPAYRKLQAQIVARLAE
jgi:tetratricopeptide (TPR) repeat protein